MSEFAARCHIVSILYFFVNFFKTQSNLLKFEGLQLPGGTTLNGRQIFDDATTELQMLDDEIFTKYQLPDDFMVG